MFQFKPASDIDDYQLSALPMITLAGDSYWIARLPLRHRIAVSLLMPKIKAIIERFPRPEDIKAGATVEISEDDYNVLIDLVSHGLRKLYPAATREALLDEPIAFEELFAAWPVIVQQAASRRPAAGEVEAPVSSMNDTGASSSPTSH